MRKVTARYKEPDERPPSDLAQRFLHSRPERRGGVTRQLPGSADSVSDSSLLTGSPTGLDGEVRSVPWTGQPWEKQAKVMQRLKMMEQPLSMK